MILVIGKSGQVAKAIADTVPKIFSEGVSTVEFCGRETCDLSQPSALYEYVLSRKPNLVINAAAYTAVDLAETQTQLAETVNAEAPEALAKACAQLNIPLIHYSSDYVYSGSGESPFREDAPLQPLNAYGRTKAHGDLAIAKALSKHVILRTSWVYHVEGKNFVATMLRLGAERETLRVVSDQIGSPTSALEIARATWRIAQAILRPEFNEWGTYHLVSNGFTSWHGFTLAIFEEAKRLDVVLKVKDVQPIATSEYPTPAKRPLNSRLDTSRLQEVFGIRLKDWREALRECLQTIAQKSSLQKAGMK